MSVALLDEFGVGSAREREESWRYSKAALRALSQQAFVAANTQAELPEAVRNQFEWPETNGHRLVFANGAFSPIYSDTTALCKSHPDIEIRHGPGNRLVVIIPARHVDKLHLIYVNISADSASRWEANSEIHLQGHAHIIEQHVGDRGADVLGALASKIIVSERANLQLTTVSDLPGSVSLYRRVDMSTGNASGIRSTHAILGSRLQRFDLNVDLRGARSTFTSRGVFLLNDRQHADMHLDVRHVARDTSCDLLWRGIADGRARGVFHGAITIAAGADGSDARLSNKNLLLSPQAEIDTQPVLEIHADEVQASHGATVGQLDEGALFYLRSRGMPAAEARAMLTHAFCRETLDAVPLPALREWLGALLLRRLPAGAAA